MKTPPPGLSAAAKAAQSRIAPSEERLERVRGEVRRARDLELEIAELTEKLNERNGQLHGILSETLPTMFQEVGIDQLGLLAEGNLPAYDAKLNPFYRASISASWPQERQELGFAWLEREGHGDIIKKTFTVELPRGSEREAKKLRTALVKTKLPFSERKAVHSGTLTAFVKEQVEKHGTTPPLELLGATVGKVVKLKERKN